MTVRSDEVSLSGLQRDHRHHHRSVVKARLMASHRTRSGYVDSTAPIGSLLESRPRDRTPNPCPISKPHGRGGFQGGACSGLYRGKSLTGLET
jgi:hypothetical protein